MTNSLWASLRTAYDNGTLESGGALVGGDIFYVDAVNGSDISGDGSRSKPYAGLTAAYDACTSGENDTVVILPNGASTGSVRVDAAFTWAKNSTHLVGLANGNRISSRARIAPTATTTAFANFFTITGDGCLFKNVQFWHGFNTGTTAAIAVTLNGAHYNRFENVHFAGMGDAASAQSATSRALKIYNSGENEFVRCTFGVDTVARTVANTLVELGSAGGASYNPRNKFIDCDFLAWTTTVQTQTDFLVSIAGAVDRWLLVDRCRFLNSLFSSGYLIQTAVVEAPALTGGVILFKDCALVGRTGFGKDATTRGFLKIEGGTPAAATTGLAVAPTA